MKYKPTSFLILILALGFYSVTFAGEPDEFSQFPTVEDDRWNIINANSLNLLQLNKAAELLNENLNDGLFDDIIRGSNDFSTDCMKVTGNENLCRCLDKNRSVWLNFSDYVKIVTNQKGITFSSELSADDIKKLVEITQDTRDLCVTNVQQ